MTHVTRGHGIASIVFGVLELLLGIIIIVCGFIAAAKIKSALYAPYWIGFVYLVPGILGIAAGASKNNGCMVAFMILNIIVFIVFGIGSIILFIGISVISIIFDNVAEYCYLEYGGCRCTYQGTSFTFNGTCSNATALMPALWAIAVFCLFSGIVTLASSILGCVSSCCTTPPPVGGLVIQEHLPQSNPPVYIQQQQQLAYAPPQYPGSKAGPV